MTTRSKRKAAEAKIVEASEPEIEQKEVKAAPKKAKAVAPKEKVEKAAAVAPKKASSSKKLAVGDNISSVGATLITEEEKEVTLAELTKEKGIVIFMYPKANTGGWCVCHHFI